MKNEHKIKNKMVIEKIVLKNYRNYDNLEINFNKNLNIIIGNNAQGKTNLLESIYTLAITKPFLSINEKNLIKNNEKFLNIKGYIEKNKIKKKLEIIIDENNKKVKVNDKEINKLSSYISNLNVIVFSSEDIRSIKESPNSRRKYLNIELSQLYNNYIKIFNNFVALLKKRNEYLKLIVINNKYNETYLKILNENYVDLAIDVFLYRKEFIDSINLKIGKIYKDLSNQEKLKIKYISNIDYCEDKKTMKAKLLAKLNKHLEKEKTYRMTLIGPHRDDFCFYLNEKNMSLYGSQGQIRLSILSLKFSEIFIFKEHLKENPILLLDDIFSELDLSKRNKVLKCLNNDVQKIITTTDLKLINKEILKNANIYKVKEGKITNKKTGRK